MIRPVKRRTFSEIMLPLMFFFFVTLLLKLFILHHDFMRHKRLESLFFFIDIFFEAVSVLIPFKASLEPS